MPRPRSELARDLRDLGVATGDVVMVHASLRAVGPVEGGAAGVVAALEDAVGSTGTLVMNLGAREEPGAPFNAARTPADPDVGVLAEVFRALPGTLVNDHPDARFGARGRLAATLLDEPLPWDDYYGPGSVLARLVEAGAKLLRLGADPDTVTLLHLAEYLADVPAKRRVVRHHGVALQDGTTAVRAVSCLDDSDGIVDWDGEDYFAVILRDYLTRGRAHVGRVGGARSELIDAADLLAHGIGWMNAQLGDRDPATIATTSRLVIRPWRTEEAERFYDMHEEEVEIGWHLHPDAWGRGLATEAARAVLAGGLDEVWAVTHPDNRRSVGVCRKLGMHLLGVTQRWYHEPSLMF